MFTLIFSGNLHAQNIKTSSEDGMWTSINWIPTGVPANTDNIVINTTVTIPYGTTVEVNNLTIASNGKLNINGKLKVNGNLTMENNSPQFNMGDKAVVTITGDFIASNKINISISSYLIIQGDFKKEGSSNQGDLDVSNGNIYIFGEVEGFPTLSACDGTYDGSTVTEKDQCDYGTEDDYINNQETFPPDVQTFVNCFNVTINDISVCSSLNAVFKIAPITGVKYRWQEKTSSGIWKDISGATGNSLTVSNVTVSQSGNKYRIIITSINPDNKCKIGISTIATLIVKNSTVNIPKITGNTQICPNLSGLIYSIPATDEYVTYKWNLPSDWILEKGQNSNTIIVTSGKTSGANSIKITVTNSCGKTGTKELSVNIASAVWTGNFNFEWNNQDNWSCNMIPTLTTNVSIPSGLSNYPLLNKGSAGFCKDITVSSSATLEVLNNNLNISGVINNNGSFNAENGTVTLKGESSQSIPANTFTNNRISNLIIDNNLGASINGELEIKGILKVAIGNLNTKGFVTLISNASQTALIDGSGNGEIIGTVKLQRYLDSARGYKYFSSPFSNSTVGDFSNHVDLSASFPQVYFYKENNKSDDNKDISGWKSYTNASSGLATLAGYAFNFGTSEDAATIELSGIVNNGSYSRQVSNNNGKYTQGFNLVGNPYPSPIDWNATGWTKINVDDAIYFFSANAQYTGTYSSFVNGVSSSGASSPGIIPTMQGFFVHVSDGRDPKSITTGTLGVSNSVRVNDFNQPFYKRSDASPKGLIRIIADINDNISKDAMVIYFDPFATENFDTDKDALKLMNIDKNVPNLYSLNKDQNKLSISSLPEIAKNSTKRIPLGINMEVGGELRLHLKDLENLPSNFNVYLIDDEKHIGQNLSQKPVYKTQIKAGEYNSRFYLIFSKSEITDAAVVFDEPFSIKTVDGQVLVKMNLKDGEKGILQATTVTGQILEQKDAKGIETIHLNGIKSSGLYFINLSWNNQQFSRKIIIQK